MRNTRWIAMLIAMVVLLAACGREEETDDGGADPGPGTPAPGDATDGATGDISGPLTVWAMGNEGANLQVMADLFMDEYPEVEVSVTPIDWGVARDRLLTGIASGETPDVSQMGTDMMGEFASTGALAPVPDGVDAAQFFESAWTTNVVDETVYGVPWYVETRVLYYRTDLAEAAGIDGPPETWEDLKAMAQAFQDGGAEWGIGLGTTNSQEYLPFVWSNGGEILTEDGQFALDSPEAVEALEFYDSFFEEGLAATAIPEGFDITPAFVQGTHPMFFSGPWHISLIEDAGGAEMEGNWDVAPMPANDSATSFVGGSNLVVYENSENPDAAWAFVQFLTQPETQVRWYEEVTVLPAVQSAWDEEALSGDERVAVFGQQLEDTNAPPAIATWGEIAAAINDGLEQVTVGDVAPADGASSMQQAAEGIGTE